tara:strand:- start:70586 stop:72709 length:2124 start_codon:yes stop_codon:yes gene_type:complete
MKVSLLVLTFITLSISQNTHSQVRRGNPQYSGGGTSSSGSTSSYRPSGDMRRHEGNNPERSMQGCSHGEHIPVQMLKNLTDPAIPYNEALEVVRLNGRQGKVTLKNYVAACISPKFLKVEVNQNIFIRTLNEYEYKDEELNLQDGETAASLPMEEKHRRCLETKGLLSNDGSVNYYKARQLGHVRNIPFPFDYNSADKSKSVSVYFGSPSISTYDLDNQVDDRDISAIPSESEWSCLSFENPVKNKKTPVRLYTSQQDLIYDDAIKACEHGDPLQIYNELKELRSSNVGNYRDLARILEDAFNKSSEEEVNKIYEELNEIADKFKKDDDGKIPSETYALSKAREYKEKLKRLEKISIDPLKEELKLLMDSRNADNAEEVDAKIAEINGKIGKLYENHQERFYTDILPVLAKYGIKSEADSIAKVLLQSKHFAKVNETREGVDFDKAQDKYDDDLGKFMAKTADYRDTVAVREGGSTVPIEDALKDLRNLERRMERDMAKFKSWAQKEEKKNCKQSMLGGMQNQRKCQRWRKRYSRAEKNFLKRRKRSLLSYKDRYGEYSKYERLYNDWADKNDEDSFGDLFEDDDYSISDFDFDYDSSGNSAFRSYSSYTGNNNRQQAAPQFGSNFNYLAPPIGGSAGSGFQYQFGMGGGPSMGMYPQTQQWGGVPYQYGQGPATSGFYPSGGGPQWGAPTMPIHGGGPSYTNGFYR